MESPLDPDKLRVLSLSLVFPNPSEPILGVFVRSRLAHVAAKSEIKVVAPVSLTDYGRMWVKGKRSEKAIPRSRQDGPLEVFHPRWVYPPGGGFLNPFFLFSALYGQLLPIRRR